ncbi:MAG: hypothetical protein Ct9H300mP1_18040 [Planctomycetaceae bacterium]|nr:MAG: hypothetical protein Ct9H300mP1_18040 [Planctomycetaceae bacterium]
MATALRFLTRNRSPNWPISVTKTVDHLGAANTLLRTPDGAWKATNTDLSAAIDSLRAALEEGQFDKVAQGTQMPGAGRRRGRPCCCRGAGGRRCGGDRQRSGRGNAPVTWPPSWDARKPDGRTEGPSFADILINCTPVGMHPGVDESPFQTPVAR